MGTMRARNTQGLAIGAAPRFASGSTETAAVSAPVAPAPRTATGFGGGGGTGAELSPITFAVVELQYEPLVVESWIFVPNLIPEYISPLVIEPVISQAIVSMGAICKGIPLVAGTFIAQTGVRSGVLYKELTEHRHDAELGDLRARLQDLEDMRFLGLM